MYAHYESREASHTRSNPRCDPALVKLAGNSRTCPDKTCAAEADEPVRQTGARILQGGSLLGSRVLLGLAPVSSASSATLRDQSTPTTELAAPSSPSKTGNIRRPQLPRARIRLSDRDEGSRASRRLRERCPVPTLAPASTTTSTPARRYRQFLSQSAPRSNLHVMERWR